MPSPTIQTGNQLAAYPTQVFKNAVDIGVRRTQVEEQNSNISSALDRLQRVTESLQSRLSSVTAVYPACDDAKCAPDACLVPLADLLRSHHRRINSVASQIEALLANIEL